MRFASATFACAALLAFASFGACTLAISTDGIVGGGGGGDPDAPLDDGDVAIAETTFDVFGETVIDSTIDSTVDSSSETAADSGDESFGDSRVDSIVDSGATDTAPDTLIDVGLDATIGTGVPIARTGSSSSGTVSVLVAGRFQIDFTKDAAWQAVRWFDLGTAPGVDLANKSSPTDSPTLVEPIILQDTASNYFDTSVAITPAITVLEENPARVVLSTTYKFHQTTPPDSGLPCKDTTMRADYTLYASGRVAVNSSLHNDDVARCTVDNFDYCNTQVEPSLPWTGEVLVTKRAFAWQRGTGASPTPNLLVVCNGEVGFLASDVATNRYMQLGYQEINAGGTMVEPTELQVWPGGQSIATLTARADDVLNPALSVVSGGAAVGTGFDRQQEAYILNATSTSLSFYPNADRTRFSPVFVISNWTSASYVISLGGVPVASSGKPVGARAVASYDAAKKQLLIVSLDTLDTTTTGAARTFTVTP